MPNEWIIDNDNGNQVMKFIGNAANQYLRQSDVYTPNDKIRLQFTLSNFTSGQFRAISTGVVWSTPNINATNGTFTYDIDTTGTSNGHIYFQAVGGSFNGYLDDVSVIKITDDTDLPRIDYTNGVGSILLEPQSTNLITYSEQFDDSYWTKARSSIISNQITAPNGTDSADKFFDSTDNNTHLVYRSLSVSTSDEYTFSCFLKKGSLNKGFLAFDSSVNASVVFDLENGTIESEGSSITSSNIEQYSNNWYKCSFTHTPTATPRLYRIGTYNGGISYAGTGTDFIYIWGAQFEEQSYATSYIPTSGSTVTRNADVCNNAGSSDLINSTEGVLYAEIKALSNDATRRDITISNGTTSNRVMLRYDNASNRVQAFIQVGGATNGNMNSIAYTITNFLKIAYKWKAGDFALWINGTEVGTSTDATSFSADTLTEVNFDRGENNAEFFYGNVKSVAVFKEALTDEELAKITSTTQQEVFYEMRDKMLQINADYYEFGDYTTRLKKLF